MLLILPVGDVTPRKSSAVVNWLLIGANLIIFIWVWYVLPGKRIQEIGSPDTMSQERQQEIAEKVIRTTVEEYALVPAEFAWDSPNAWLRVFSSMFLHGGLVHLLGNLLFLFIAGPRVEDRLGHGFYLFFYLACGVAGAFAHIFSPWSGDPTIPMVGASGAISGVIGAYLLFFPRSEIKFMLLLVIFIRPFNLPSWGAIGLWLGAQILMALPQIQGKAPMTNVAVLAHLGGFALGFLVALFAAVTGLGREKSK